MREERITSGLSPEARAFYRVRAEETVTSTNTLLKQLAAEGAPEGTVLAAAHQTAGRGRMGHSFYSPEGTGVYLSLLVRPGRPAAESVILTCLCASAAAAACEETAGVAAGSIGIKWVNDLMYRDRKIAGILTEAGLAPDGNMAWAVIGIGFNLSPPKGGWPAEIGGIAGSLFEEAPDGARERLAAAFLSHFLPLYRQLSERTFLSDYAARQTVVGHRVAVLSGDEEIYTAEALGVDEDCRLLVRTEDGAVKALGSGDVRVRRREDET